MGLGDGGSIKFGTKRGQFPWVWRGGDNGHSVPGAPFQTKEATASSGPDRGHLGSAHGVARDERSVVFIMVYLDKQRRTQTRRFESYVCDHRVNGKIKVLGGCLVGVPTFSRKLIYFPIYHALFPMAVLVGRNKRWISFFSKEAGRWVGYLSTHYFGSLCSRQDAREVGELSQKSGQLTLGWSVRLPHPFSNC